MIRVVIGIVSSAIIIAGAVVLHGAARDAQVTRVIFLDVGQGDAILITRGDRQILIDGGADEKRLLEKLARYMPPWDRTVDVLVATHPDADHIGAQIAVLRTLHVPVVIATRAFKKSRIATAWHSALVRARAKVIMADQYVRIALSRDNDAHGILRVIYPRRETNIAAIRNVNDTSIVLKLTIGASTFLFTGDLSQKQERNIPAGGISVLKVGHHGSDTSTSRTLLERIAPHDAVISVGADNRYGHPHADVIERLRSRDIQVLRTDKHGDIIYTCRARAACMRMTERQVLRKEEW